MAQTRVTSVELNNKVGFVIDLALAEPVVITRHGRDHLVMLSARRYASLLAALPPDEQAEPVGRRAAALSANEFTSAKIVEAPGASEVCAGAPAASDKRSHVKPRRPSR